MFASNRSSYWRMFAKDFADVDASAIENGADAGRLEIMIAGEWMLVDRFDLTIHGESDVFMRFGTSNADVIVRVRDIQALRWVYGD